MKSRFSLRAKDHLTTSEGKRDFNEKHFAESASRYDFATKALSFGQDAGWKKRLVDELPELDEPVCLDIACGTGDVTFLLAGKYPRGQCTGIDLTAEMIAIANDRNKTENSKFVRGDMSDLPFEASSVDVLTGSYAIRNAPDLPETLVEFRRVLKPGGTLAFLDFSKADTPLGQALQYWALRFWGGLWGLILHGSVEIHGYISKSLAAFPVGSELERAFQTAGFEVGKSIPLLGGMMRLYVLRG